MFSAEELHPAAERLRHAQLVAALHNGALTRKNKKLWEPGEFLRDPWKRAEPRRPLTPAQVARQVASLNAMRRGSRGRQ